MSRCKEARAARKEQAESLRQDVDEAEAQATRPITDALLAKLGLGGGEDDDGWDEDGSRGQQEGGQEEEEEDEGAGESRQSSDDEEELSEEEEEKEESSDEEEQEESSLEEEEESSDEEEEEESSDEEDARGAKRKAPPELTDARVEIYWTGERTWFKGVVAGQAANSWYSDPLSLLPHQLRKRGAVHTGNA